MNSRIILVFLSLITALAWPIHGYADEFNRVQADKSTLVFAFKQMGLSLIHI